ncbi:TIGAR-like protein [Mya arenaria]|uniref:TIGAR-like protein n=1 Tax=Mya arenaria TaxID=6604 RepID=A0ABY7ECC8_MYAAR|nr:TIGAR-like protein [Mya arenaria]
MTSARDNCLVLFGDGGQMDVPLSSVGEQQAGLVAARLQRERFTHIFSSDLSRASDTAKIIAQANKKFGELEGKQSKELMHMVKKAKKKYLDYTPPGAESCLQEAHTPAKIKRRHGGSLGRHSRQSNKRLQLSGRSQSFCSSGNPQHIISEMTLMSDEEDCNENSIYEKDDMCQTNSYITMQDNDNFGNNGKVLPDYQYRDGVQSSSDDSSMSGDLRHKGSLQSEADTCSETSSDRSPSSQDMNGSESDSTLSEFVCHKVPLSFGSEIQTSPHSPHFTHPSPCPTAKRPAEELERNSQSYECPNVSLTNSSSAHQFSSISSISSGRNSSFDDLEGLPLTVADILIVSHGGFIKECLRYFVDSLDCKIPGVKGHALKVCPNCSVSKFNITIDESTGHPSVTCILIHDKDHLIDLNLPPAKGTY